MSRNAKFSDRVLTVNSLSDDHQRFIQPIEGQLLSSIARILQNPSDADEALQSVDTIHISGWSNSLSTFIGVHSSDFPDVSKPMEIEAWEWIDDGGHFHSFKKGRPYIVREEAERRYEYNADTDTLWIKKPRIELLNKVATASVHLLDATQNSISKKPIWRIGKSVAVSAMVCLQKKTYAAKNIGLTKKPVCRWNYLFLAARR